MSDMSKNNTTEQAEQEWNQLIGMDAVGEASQAMLNRLTNELPFNAREKAVLSKVILCDSNVDVEPLMGRLRFIIRLIKPNHIPAMKKGVITVPNNEQGYNDIKVALTTLYRSIYLKQTPRTCFDFNDVRWFLTQGGRLYVNQWSYDEFLAMSELPAHLLTNGSNDYLLHIEYHDENLSNIEETKLVSIYAHAGNFFYRIDDKHIYFLHGIYLPEAVFSDADSVTLLTLIRLTKD